MNSDWYKWLIPTISFLIIYYGLYLFQQQFLSRIKKIQFTNPLWKDIAVEVVGKFKKISFFLFAIFLTLLTVEVSPQWQSIVQRCLKVVILLHIGQISVLVLKMWLKQHLNTSSSDDQNKVTTINLIGLISQFIIYSLIFLLILNNLGVDITALIAGLGVGGIAIALAVQSILSDLFSSLTIVLDKPFVVGDNIRVGELDGIVEKIGLKTTRLKSISGEHLVIGNSDLLQSRIRNFKHMNERRVIHNLTIVYQTHPDILEKIPLWIEEIVNQNSFSRFERCHLLRFLDSALDFELVYWIKSSDFQLYADTSQKVNFAIIRKFALEKVEFAYPTRTIFNAK